MEIQKNIPEIKFDWVETGIVKDPQGNQVQTGTLILLGDNILFLQSYSLEELDTLKKVINQAVDYELSTRKTE